MNVLATILKTQRRPNRSLPSNRSPDIAQRRFARIPSRVGLVVAFAGLLILLLTPMMARQHAQRYRAHLENDIEPARSQITQMLSIAYEVRGSAFMALVLPEDHPEQHKLLPLPPINNVMQRWSAALRNDRAIAACGSETYRAWQQGKNQLNAWAFACNQPLSRSPIHRAQELRQANTLFESGIAALRRANASAQTQQLEARHRFETIGRLEIAVTVPVSLLCLLMAATTWQTQARLRRFWMREHVMNQRLQQANVRLEALATTDGLTGLKNHRAFQEWLDGTFRLAVRHGRPLSLLMVDVDRFKQYNDAYGHPAGDDVLKQVAHILRTTCRGEDIAARYGGEEFVVVLPETESTGAILLAERFRSHIANASWPLSPVTISIGVATWNGGTSDQAQLIANADDALYASKHKGRNCVTHAADLYAADPFYAVMK